MDTLILVLDLLYFPLVLAFSALVITIWGDYFYSKLEILTAYVVKKGWM